MIFFSLILYVLEKHITARQRKTSPFAVRPINRLVVLWWNDAWLVTQTGCRPAVENVEFRGFTWALRLFLSALGFGKINDGTKFERVVERNVLCFKSQ